MPMQMAGVMAVTPFVKFNVPLAIAVVWLSNPITYPIMFYVEYITGNFLLQQNGVEHIEMTMQWFKDNWEMIEKLADFPPGMSSAVKNKE